MFKEPLYHCAKPEGRKVCGDTDAHHMLRAARNRTSDTISLVLSADPIAWLWRCLPSGCSMHIQQDAGVVHATITIVDRAPYPSIAGGMTLSLAWDTQAHTAILQGTSVSIEELPAILDAYDRQVNWSAIQEMGT